VVGCCLLSSEETSPSNGHLARLARVKPLSAVRAVKMDSAGGFTERQCRSVNGDFETRDFRGSKQASRPLFGLKRPSSPYYLTKGQPPTRAKLMSAVRSAKTNSVVGVSLVALPPRKLVSLRLASQRLKVSLETALRLQTAAYHVPVCFHRPVRRCQHQFSPECYSTPTSARTTSAIRST